MSLARRGIAAAAALLISQGATGHAQEVSGAEGISKEKMFQLRGFGTLALTHSSEKNADFITSAYQPNGAGYTRNPDYGVDSRVGLQMDVKFSDRIRGVVQVVSERQHDGTFTPVLEWANVRFEITPNFSVRLGRVSIPVFMESDTRKVGYAITWLRPPVDAYSICPLTANDGIDVSYRLQLGQANLTLQGALGNADADRPGGTKLKARDGKLINAMLEYKSLIVRANYVTQHMTIEGAQVDTLFNGLRSFGTAVAPYSPSASQSAHELASAYEADGKKTSSYGVGAILDPGGWLVQAEWVRRTSESFLADQTAWYVNGGYRLGKFTPYAGVSAVKSDSERQSPGIPMAGLPAPFVPNALVLNGGLNAILMRTSTDQRSWTAGVRWDLASKMDLKLQLDQVTPMRDSYGTFTNIQPGTTWNKKVYLVSAALDFIF